MAHPVDT